MKKPLDTRLSKAGLLLVAVLGLPLLSACVTHNHPAPHGHRHVHGGVRVAVTAGHVHGPRCGHYRHRGHWYHLRGHVHGGRCGHAFVGGIWVLRR